MKLKMFGITRLPFRRAEQVTQRIAKGEKERKAGKEEGEGEEGEEGEEELVKKSEEELEEELEREEVEEDETEEEARKPTYEEQLALVVEHESSESEGEDCELHVYERRRDTRGEEVYLRAGIKSEFAPPKRRSHRACLILTRYYDPLGHLSFKEVEIQSRYIIKVLRKVIRTCPDVDLGSKYVIITEPPKCFFHYQDQIREHAEASENSQLKSHIHLFLQYMERSLHREIELYKALIADASMYSQLEHQHLWMLFKPRCLIYNKHDGLDDIVRLQSMSIEEDEDEDDKPFWRLTIEEIRFLGDSIGFISRYIDIKHYDGSRSIADLKAFPLSLHREEERIRFDLLKRGQKFLSLCNTQHCFYNGSAYLCYTQAPRSLETEYTNVRHRIVIDAKNFQLNVQGYFDCFIPGMTSFTSATEAKSNLSDEDIMTSCLWLPGYSLDFKRWGHFILDNITEVTYNNQAFNSLVLPEKNKKLISCLLERREDREDDEFDDLIQGKGKGLIFLLHGPPGVGKTYTAESLADHTRRPLLKVSSSELDGPGPLVEKRLSQLFDLSTSWNAIMLLDEADVFMQERTLHSVITNQLVSTLLRTLEYYEGILFLTTNRVETIDHAFMSRIHLSIAYPPLSPDARCELWSSSIARANHGRAPEWLTTSFLHHLAEKSVNGREIRNIVRTGYSLARNAKRDMMPDDLLRGLEALEQFTTDFNKWSEDRKTKT